MCYVINSDQTGCAGNPPSLLQDELEFGYVEAPHQCFPVVLDSPRDGDLKDFPYNELLVRTMRGNVIFEVFQILKGADNVNPRQCFKRSKPG